MFLLRSVFWLTVMFIIVAPKDFDLGKAAGEASQQVIAIGQQAVVEQVLATDCQSLECTGGKATIAVLAAGNQFPSVEAMQPATITPVPLPRPRPDRMG
jgi:hypothetical protein